jgi:hypothetical protein
VYDWLAIAKLLVEHGIPDPEPIEDASDASLQVCRIDGKIQRFSEDVTDFLLKVGKRA